MWLLDGPLYRQRDRSLRDTNCPSLIDYSLGVWSQILFQICPNYMWLCVTENGCECSPTKYHKLSERLNLLQTRFHTVLEWELRGWQCCTTGSKSWTHLVDRVISHKTLSLISCASSLQLINLICLLCHVTCHTEFREDDKIETQDDSVSRIYKVLCVKNWLETFFIYLKEIWIDSPNVCAPSTALNKYLMDDKCWQGFHPVPWASLNLNPPAPVSQMLRL